MEKLSEVSSIIKRDNRSINPGSPFKYNTNFNYKSNIARKTLGDGRINKVFKGKTSTLKDDDIRHLITVYPVEGKRKTEEDEINMQKQESQKDFLHGKVKFINKLDVNKEFNDPIYEALTNTDNKLKQKLYRKALESMTNVIDRMELEKKAEYQDMITKFV